LSFIVLRHISSATFWLIASLVAPLPAQSLARRLIC